MASAQIERILKVYKSVIKNPALTAARIEHIGETGVVVQSSWTQRDLELRDNYKFGLTHTLKPDLQLLEGTSFPADRRLQLACAYTEDGKKKAELRTAVVENKTKQFIHIWEGLRWVQNYDLAALDVHGDVYTDIEFGTFQWSPDGTKLLYIAEKKLPKSEPFGKSKPLEKKAKKDEDQVAVGEEYVYKPHWGEQLVGKHRPVAVVLDTTTETITVQPGIADDLSPGQLIWTPEGDGIVGVALKHEPRYLGLYACSNRISWIFLLKNGSYRNLSENGCAVRSPRFSLDGKHLVWLEREAGGPHQNAQRIMRLKWEPQLGKTDILLDVVRTSKAINFGAIFYGMFNRNFPQRCWSSDSSYLFFSTPQRFNVRSYALNIESKTLTEIENGSTSLSIVDVRNDIVLFHEMSLLESSSLWIGTFDEKTLGKIPRNPIVTPIKIPGFENFKYEMLEHEVSSNEKVRDFNSMYFGPKSGEDKAHPLIILPHGGPHVSYCNTFSTECSLLALLGYAVLQINYRGSTGMGADNVEFLQGRVGDTDVKDCAQAAKLALEKYPWLDNSRVGLCGGSHGGFLVAHLSGQYTNQFKAVVMRNPVIDIAAMFTISDIPDWCAAEAGFSYKENEPSMDSPEAADMVVKMFKASPIIYVNKVKAPTLVCLGSNDLRVPPSQGKHWYHRLKANGVKTKMLVYDDNHSLATGTTEIDFVMNTAIWFEDNLRAGEEINSISMDTSSIE